MNGRLILSCSALLLLGGLGCSDGDGTTDGGSDTSVVIDGTTGDSASDTGGSDMGTPDTGGSDTGTSDTGASDTSTSDTGGGDTSMEDTGVVECPPPCAVGRDCCDGECVNLQNDPRNCGACGTACGAGTYCTGGSCVDIPCMASCGMPDTCCGTMCCGPGTVCCDPQGPISVGPECVPRDARGTCPVGCAPLCVEG